LRICTLSEELIELDEELELEMEDTTEDDVVGVPTSPPPPPQPVREITDKHKTLTKLFAYMIISHL